MYVQILDCSSDISSCCNDYGLAGILAIIKQALTIIQIIVPIILIVMASINLFQMIVNPDEKKNIKALVNKFVAAIIVFLLPFVVNLVIELLPETFNLTSCWNDATTLTKEQQSRSSTYISSTRTAQKFSTDPSEYELGTVTSNASVEEFITQVDAVYKMAYNNGYSYGDSHSTPPSNDGVISCDRLIARALWNIGYTDQVDGGFGTDGDMEKYLESHNFIKITDINSLQRGDIVVVRRPDGTEGHTFVITAYDSSTGICSKYDEGSDARVHSIQPFTNVQLLEWSDRIFISAYRLNN